MFQIDETRDRESGLRLVGELTIYAAAEAKALLSAALDECPRLVLNLAGVEELDTAGVQLLAWLKQEARRRGRTLVMVAPSPAVAEVLDLLRLSTYFSDPDRVAPSI